MTASAKILIVDDFEDSADITAAFLEDGGFPDVSIANSAMEAYATLGIEPEQEGGSEDKPFDLVILDIVLPEIDGIEACARIRLHPPYRNLPILMLSAVDNVELLNQAFVAGANDFVRKPVEQISLLARVRSLLRLKREQERRQAREAQIERQTRDLQRGALDSTLIDPLTQLPSAPVIDLTLRSCQQNQHAACIAMLRIDGFAEFKAEQGEESADLLQKRVAEVIAAAPGPLAAIPVAYGEGTFIVVVPRPSGVQPITRSCDFVRQDVAALALPLGGGHQGGIVTVSTLAALAEAEDLPDLMPRVLTGFEREWREPDSHIILD